MKSAIAIVLLVACGDPTALAIDAAPADGGVVDGAIRDAAPDAPLVDTAPDPATALQQLPGFCSSDEWCWQWPTPHGNPYFQVFATGADNLWLTGGAGTVLQWDGLRWRRHVPPSQPGQEYLRWPWKLHGSSASDMWMIYGTAVEHWDGAQWTIFETGPIDIVPWQRGLWTDPAGDTWLTSGGTVKRSHAGGPFEGILAATGVSIWGTAPGDFFVSVPGSILRYNGSSLLPVYNDATRYPGDYMGQAGDVWASGGQNTLLHWDGKIWTPLDTGLGPQAWPMKIGYVAPNDVWWFTAYGNQGSSFIHWNGTSLEVTPVDVASYGEHCCASLETGTLVDGTWWLAGGDGAVYTKTGPSTIRPIISPRYEGTSMWGTSDTDMYFASGGGVRHWDGTAMTELPVKIGGISGVAGAGVGGTSELFGVGVRIDFGTNEYVYSGYHFDGATWSQQDLFRSPIGGPNMRGLGGAYAIAAGEALAVGTDGVAYRFHDGSWELVATGTTADLAGIWGPSSDRVWISGAAGTLLRWERAQPEVMTPEPDAPMTTGDLGVIHGAGGVMWVAQMGGTTVWTGAPGQGWSSVNAGMIVADIDAASATSVWFAGSQQYQLAHWNGTEVVHQDSGSYKSMTQLFRPPGGKLWLAGSHGVVVHP